MRSVGPAPRDHRVSVALLLILPCVAHAETNAFGKKFLQDNKLKEGVKTLPSGLQYRVLEEGVHMIRNSCFPASGCTPRASDKS